MKLLKSLLSGTAMFLVLVVFLAAWIALPWPALLGLAVLFALWMLLARSGRQSAAGPGRRRPGQGRRRRLIRRAASAASSFPPAHRPRMHEAQPWQPWFRSAT